MLRIVGPSGLVAPDGFPIAVVREDASGQPVAMHAPQISADGAELRPGIPEQPLSTFVAVPRERSRTVIIRASDAGLKAEVRFAVGPPAARVELVLQPATPVKGRDTEAQLSVRLLRPDGSADPESSPPVLRANVGQITGLQQDGPGQFRARYLLPETRYPEVAVIAAFAPWPAPSSVYGAVGRLLVPLSASVTLPGHTEPNARMSIEIGGVKYGPVDAAPDGRFDIPVVVPPGRRFGTGTAVDRAGNKRVSQVDLMLPPTDQVACVMNPPRLPADGTARARLLCASSDPFGNPARNARLEVAAHRGQLAGPRVVDEGLQEWIYTAPRGASGAGDVVTAQWRSAGPQSREELEVTLAQGRAATLQVHPAEPLVHKGSELPVAITVADGLGAPRAGAHVLIRPSVGTALVTEQTSSGTGTGSYAALFRPPEQTDALAASLEVRALGPPGTEPARLTAWMEQGQLFAAAVDLAGLPVPAQAILVGGVQRVSDADGVLALGGPPRGPLELAHAQWPGLRLLLYGVAGGHVWPRGAMPGAGPVTVPVALGPPTPVNVRLEVHGHQVRYWVEDPRGQALPRREVEVALSGGTRGPEHDDGRAHVFEVTATEPVTVSVADRLTGVTALAEVRP